MRIFLRVLDNYGFINKLSPKGITDLVGKARKYLLKSSYTYFYHVASRIRGSDFICALDMND